jgi:hypothetical protein
MWQKSGDMMAAPILRKFSLCKNHSARDVAASSMDAKFRREKYNCRANDSMKV